MGEIARWNGHKFEVSSNVIRSFTGLSIKGSSETKDKGSSNQKYVERKNGKPKEISLTANLHTQLGCDVKSEAMAFVDEATAGKKDYFYIGSKKLMTCSMMLTEASVDEIGITNSGAWTKADVKLTFKQCSKNDSSTSTSGSGGGGSGGKTNKTSNKTSTKTTWSNITKGPFTWLTNPLQDAQNKINKAAQDIQKAKAATQQKKKTTAKGGLFSRVNMTK